MVHGMFWNSASEVKSAEAKDPLHFSLDAQPEIQIWK